jgi:hypothetical protein
MGSECATLGFVMKMPPVFFSALLAASLMVLPLEFAMAAKPVSLELEKSGTISISADGLPNMEIRTEVTDTSTGGWKRVVAKEKIEPVSGAEVTRVGTYEYPDGSQITHTVKAKIDGKSVQMAADWTPPSQAKGFSRVDLWLPQDLLQDLVITIGEKKIFPYEAAEKPRYIKNTDSLVFKRQSTGEVLFELSGDYVSIVPPWVLPDKPELGGTLRIQNVPDDMHSTIGDATQMNWTMAFK